MWWDISAQKGDAFMLKLVQALVKISALFPQGWLKRALHDVSSTTGGIQEGIFKHGGTRGLSPPVSLKLCMKVQK